MCSGLIDLPEDSRRALSTMFLSSRIFPGKEYDVSLLMVSGSIGGTVFLSSRIFPGMEYDVSLLMVSGSIGGTVRFISVASVLTKCSSNKRISDCLSRKGGVFTVNAANLK